VSPLPAGAAERVIEEAFGRPAHELFATFATVPIAAASIAQVHRGTLPSGASVAIKVRRPGIAAVIDSDLAILADLATLAERHIPDATLYSLPALVEEFARTIRREQNLAREGRIMARVAGQFEDDPTVRLPAVHWPLTTAAVLTMDYLDGVRVSAVGTPNAPSTDPALVARRGADAVLKQILVHGLFHADPHPGTILVLPGNVIGFVDFGIVGRVNRRVRERLADAIAAVAQRDTDRLAEIVLSLTSVQRPVDVSLLTRDLDEMLDVYGNVSLGDLSLAEVLSSVVDVVSRHRLKLPADLLLLVKAIATIEGVGRQLDPSFKMVEHAAPFVEQLTREKLSPAALARRAAHAGHDALTLARSLPRDLATVVRKAGTDGLQIQFVHRNLDFFVREMDRSSNRLSFAIVIAAIVIGSAVVMQAGIGPARYGVSLVGLAGFVIAAVLGIGLAIGILRSGRL
jgi:ubiquinone biosynthesis protein